MDESLKNKLAQKERELYSIQKISRALSNTLNLDDLLRLIMGEITDLMNADRSTIYLVDYEKNEIWSKIALKAEVKEIRQTIGVGISGYVAQTGILINIPDAYNDERFDPSTDKKTGYRTESILCLPVWEPLSERDERKIIGVIQVLNKKDGPFMAEDQAILKSIASEIAISLKNAQLYEQLKSKYQEIDMLYELEQYLSSEFDFETVIRKILHKTKEHLQLPYAGVVYHNKTEYVLAVSHGSDGFFYKSLKNLTEPFSALLQKPQQDYNKNQLEIMQYYFSELEGNDLRSAWFLPYEQINEYMDRFFFVYPSDSGRGTISPESKVMIDLVVQKIARAQEIFSLRQSIVQQERLSAIGQMMSTIVHDLRSPVNNIYGFMELLLDDSCTRDERTEYGEIIRREVESVTNMTSEILDFAKGKTNILPRKLSIKKMLEKFTPQLELLFKDSGIGLHTENKTSQLIYADEEKLFRVLLNIAKNAKEAMVNSGEFYFNIYDEPGFAVFELKDTGPGIPDEIRENLFESFVTSGKENGTGLGLAIVQKIVQEHNGFIELQSEVGKGTIFYIKIPIYQQEK